MKTIEFSIFIVFYENIMQKNHKITFLGKFK